MHNNETRLFRLLRETKGRISETYGSFERSELGKVHVPRNDEEDEEMVDKDGGLVS